ncbi:MAG: iron-containing alcohol dehydrogenase [Deltaproteobacteria bacterium]|nr:iron-containing alcohol dehydrogenase [Deltaproteobacteria bacterium]
MSVWPFISGAFIGTVLIFWPFEHVRAEIVPGHDFDAADSFFISISVIEKSEKSCTKDRKCYLTDQTTINLVVNGGIMIQAEMISYKSPGHTIIGMGALEKLADELKAFESKRALLVTDRGLIEHGIDQKVKSHFEKAGIEIDTFDKVISDPDIGCLESCVEVAKQGQYDLIVGLGGGSPMDIASATSVMVTNPGKVQDYLGIDLVKNPGLPSILIPTTSGTGAEVTPNAILSDTEANLKKAIVSPYIFATLVIVDPLLTVSMPAEVTSWSGIDALTHVIECYTSKKANFYSDLFCRDAIKRIGRSLRTAVADGDNLQARYDMCVASHWGGIAITLSGTTAVHALAYPLGGQFHVAHGIANGLLLPYVMQFNAMGNIEKFADVARLLGEKVNHLTLLEQANHAADAVKALYRDLKIPQSLTELGIPKEAIPRMARAAMDVTRLMVNNPRSMSTEDAEMIYEKAL